MASWNGELQTSATLSVSTDATLKDKAISVENDRLQFVVAMIRTSSERDHDLFEAKGSSPENLGSVGILEKGVQNDQ